MTIDERKIKREDRKEEKIDYNWKKNPMTMFYDTINNELFKEEIPPITEITEENAPDVIGFFVNNVSPTINFMKKLLMLEMERLERLSKRKHKKKIALYKSIVRGSINTATGKKERRKKDRKLMEIVDGRYE